MRSGEIREAFLSYFEERGHRRVPSSPVIPQDDPTLLFANAGMNQFKLALLGKEKREYRRATSCQKCIRAGGKHNDLEKVGRTARHHTFFEMLGNFSFGDYFKEAAIEYAWEFITQILRLPKERLWVSVYKDDEQAYNIWTDRIGFPRQKMVRLGDIEAGDEENFWSMGDTGPCGPCSEILFDQGEEMRCGPDCAIGRCDCDRYLELWNLVFVQFERDSDGKMTPLQHPSVDTGMGLERIAAVMQGARSNYETDLLYPIILEIQEIVEKPYTPDETGMPFRVIADHVRALTFALNDGAIPSNEGRGYVLRRILRRASRHGRTLGIEEPFIFKLVGSVVDVMEDAYPEVKQKREYIALVIKNEEERFGETLGQGLEIFEKIADQVRRSGERVIPGREAFRLYDTYGFPLDLTVDMAEEIGMTVDVVGFESEMKVQKERAKRTSMFEVKEHDWMVLSQGDHSRFIGYEFYEAPVVVRKMSIAGDEIELILDQTPFYGESGGQVGDIGRLWSDEVEIEVIRTDRSNDAIIHHCKPAEGSLEDLSERLLKGQGRLTARIDVRRRLSAARNHTATHLLQAALRQVLGDHVRQSGSLVAPDRLRFDFTHFSPVSHRELDRVEELVNEKVRENLPVLTFEKPIDEARSMGALAFFGEKYGEVVRLVKIGDYSLEVCGGTHVGSTGEIGQFLLTSETGIAAGVRRIEALTGEAAGLKTRQELRTLTQLSDILNVPQGELVPRLEKLMARTRALEKELQRVRSGPVRSEVATLVRERGITVGDFKVVPVRVEVEDMEGFRRLADLLRESLKSGVGVLGTILGQKVSLLVVVTDDLIGKGLKAGDIARELAKIVGGGGGGRPHMAQAGGKDPGKLDEALDQTRCVVERFLKSVETE